MAAQGTDELIASRLGIVGKITVQNIVDLVGAVAPTISGVVYSPLYTSETKNITINGTGFTMSTTVSISNGTDSITVNSVTYVNSIELTVNVTTALVSGLFDVSVDNGTEVTSVDAINVIQLTTIIPDDGTTSWQGVVGMTESQGEIVPTAGGAGWGDKGGYCGTIPSSTDFTLTWKPKFRTGTSTGNFMAGVAESPAGTAFANINFCIYSVQTGTHNGYIAIYELGVSKWTGYNQWVSGDEFKIRRVSGVVSYYINNVLLYTSATSNNNSVSFDCISYQDLGAKDIKMTY